MSRPASSKTPLEWLLHAWTGANVLIGALVTLPLLFNPQVRASGPLLSAVILLLLAIVAGALLTWRMFRPSVAVLAWGTLFWALQILSLKMPGALYKFRLGLSMDLRLNSDPDIIVAVNVLGVMLTLMFAVALKDRLDRRRAG